MDNNDYENISRRHKEALESALSRFKSLFSSTSSAWKPVPPPSISSQRPDASRPSPFNSAPASGTGRPLGNGVGHVDASALHISRRKSQGKPDIVRATIDVPIGDSVDIDDFRAVLATPEVCPAWNKLSDSSRVLEYKSSHVRVAKTDFRLGWPASPRDTITISKTIYQQNTLIDISTSLPSSPDDPAYLRRSPPFVRSFTHIFAYCIQLPPPSARSSPGAKARITIIWQWDLKGIVFSHVRQHIGAILIGFIDHVRAHSDKIPFVSDFGRGVELECPRFDTAQDIFNVAYSVIHSSQASTSDSDYSSDTEISPKEVKQNHQSIKLSLSNAHGWDIQVAVQKPHGDKTKLKNNSSSTINITSTKRSSSTDSITSSDYTAVAHRNANSCRTILCISHPEPESESDVVRVSVTVNRLVGGSFIRVNRDQINVTVNTPSSEIPVPSSASVSESTNSSLSNSPDNTNNEISRNLYNYDNSFFDDASVISSEASSISDAATIASYNMPDPQSSAITSAIRRSYIYFTSLVQEPEQKWKHTMDSRGVSVFQLASIDPTVTIYRAEATFVGVGVWDLFASVITPGARIAWDKNMDSIRVVEELDELSKVMHQKTKASWPISPRDCVLVNTAYKSPQAVHIFSFSVDDSSTFQSVPPVEAGVIRTQVDLRGWAIEALSPTTTLVTLIDQSDPKGWSNKSWTPQQLVNQVASLGEFTIKSGGPPVLTRLSCATTLSSSYDPSKGSLRLEYEYDPSANSYMLNCPEFEDTIQPIFNHKSTSTIEAEIRCDCSVWSSSLDIVIDPPPSKVTCLSRHRLSSGGGCWITIEHDRESLSLDDRVLVHVKRGPPSREKGHVLINGTKAQVDVEEVSEDKLKTLSKRKRIKMPIIPLDQYAASRSYQSVTELDGKFRSSASSTPDATISSCAPKQRATPLSALLAFQENSASSEASTVSGRSTPSMATTTKPTVTWTTSRHKFPRHPSGGTISYSLEALSWVQSFYIEQGPDPLVPAPGWTVVSEKSSGISVRRKNVDAISSTCPVYRYDKVIQGLTAEQLIGVVSATSLRPVWDERFEDAIVLASFGNGCTTSSLNTKSSFFAVKGRHYRLASTRALLRVPSSSVGSSMATVYFLATASHPVGEKDAFDVQKLNHLNLPLVQNSFEGWIFETLDPYTSDQFAIPSSRCTYFTAADQGSSIAQTLSGSNSAPSRAIEGLERYVKSQGAIPRLIDPISAMYIEGPLSLDGGEDCVWRLTEHSHVSSADMPGMAISKTLLTDYLPSSKTFKCVLSIPSESVTDYIKDRNNPTSTSHPPSVKDLKSKNTSSSSSTSTIHQQQQPSKAKHVKSMSTSPNEINAFSSGTKSLRHPASTSSLRPSTSPRFDSVKSSTDADTLSESKEEDIVLADLIVDLQHYARGYEITCGSAFNESPAKASSLLDIPNSKSTKEVKEVPKYLEMDCEEILQKRDLTVRASVQEIPISAAETASLSSTQKTHPRHSVRLYLPYSQSIRDSQSISKPSWLERLTNDGATLVFTIRHTTANDKEHSHVNADGSIPLVVSLNGKSLRVDGVPSSASGNSNFMDKSSIFLPGSTISRVPQSLGKFVEKESQDGSGSAGMLPSQLEKPCMVALDRLAKHLQWKTPENSSSSTASASSAAQDKGVDGDSNSASELGVKNPTYSDDNMSEEKKISQLSKIASLGSASILGIGQSSGGLSSVTSPSTSLPSLMQNSVKSDDSSEKKGVDSQGFRYTKTFSLQFVLMVAVIAFLLGSLLRSLLTPADFILYPSQQDDQTFIQDSVLQAVDPARRWRHARRIFELRGPGTEWDLIVAQVWKNKSQ